MAVAKYQLTVAENLKLTPEVHNVHFDLVNPSVMMFIPGQRCLFTVGPKMNNYSLCNTPVNSSSIEICVDAKPKGIGSQWVGSLRAGMAAQCMGPLGNFILKNDSGYPTKVFLATGTGVSPIRSMILSLVESKHQGNVYLFFGVRSEADIFWRSEFEDLARQNNFFHYYPVLSQPSGQWGGERGYVQEILEQKFLKLVDVSRVKQSEFYLCGNSKMIEDASRVIYTYGVLPEAVNFERFYTLSPGSVA